MTEHERLTADEIKKQMQEEAMAHGKARASKVRKILDVGLERFNKMANFNMKRANPNRTDAEKYYHLFNFLVDVLEPQVKTLQERLLKNMKTGEEVVIPEFNVVITKGCDQIVFEPIARNDQWNQALKEYRIENNN